MEQNQEDIPDNLTELMEEIKEIGSKVFAPQASSSSSAGTTTAIVPTLSASQPVVEFDENTMEEFVFKKAAELIENSLSTLKGVKRTVDTAFDYRELTAMAELVAATSSSIELLNKLVVQNKKSKAAKEIKKLDSELKKEVKNTIKNQTNNILIASREDVLKHLKERAASDEVSPNNVIDVSSSES